MTRKRTSPPGQRQLRVGEEMRHALARIFARQELDDPDLQDLLVTVTEVKVSPDLKNATAFVAPLFGTRDKESGENAATLIKALNRASAYFRGQLAREINLRYSPQVRFRLDESFEQASRIEAILHDPAVARDLKRERDQDEEGEEGGDGA